MIELEPLGIRTEAVPGQNLLEVCQKAGVGLYAVCDGKGYCKKCKVKIIAGDVNPPDALEQAIFSEEELNDGWRLACQVELRGDVKVEIPAESLTAQQRLQLEGKSLGFSLDPAIKTFNCSIVEPDRFDFRSDFSRIEQCLLEYGVSPITCDLSGLQSITTGLRNWGWKVQIAVNSKNNIVGVLPIDAVPMGCAVDVGTTKVAVYLVDLNSGTLIGKDAFMNPQISFGEDVISRIAYAAQDKDSSTLQKSLVNEINACLEKVCKSVKVSPQQIVDMVIVGNTVMHHLILGLPVEQLGRSPFLPSTHEQLTIKAEEIGIKINPSAQIFFPPVVAGYVGSDHLAFLVNAQISQHPGVTLAIDIGTNTEVSLNGRGKIYSCSCASGPAFEGAHIYMGMRAVPGAIEHTFLHNREWQLSTIGDKDPIGICGSGVVDVIACLIQDGSLYPNGRIKEDAPSKITFQNANAILLSGKDDQKTSKDVILTNHDIREVQLAKAAVRTGIDILLKKGSIEPHAIDRVVVAGAFGTYLDIQSAVTIGMFPDIPIDRFEQVGNAAGIGAKDLLLSKALRTEINKLQDVMEYVELVNYENFQEIYVNALIF